MKLWNLYDTGAPCHNTINTSRTHSLDSYGPLLELVHKAANFFQNLGVKGPFTV
jgi:hypothetical protein